MLKESQRNPLFYQRFQNEMFWAIWLLVRTFIFWPIGLIGVVVVLTALLHARGDPPDFNLFRAGARGIVDFSNALVRDAPPGQVRETLACRPPAAGCEQRFVSKAEAVDRLSEALRGGYLAGLLLSLGVTAFQLIRWAYRQWRERRASGSSTL